MTAILSYIYNIIEHNNDLMVTCLHTFLNIFMEASSPTWATAWGYGA